MTLWAKVSLRGYLIPTHWTDTLLKQALFPCLLVLMICCKDTYIVKLWNIHKSLSCRIFESNCFFFKKIINFFLMSRTWRWKVSVVCDSITERFFRAPGPRTKYFERIFLSFNKLYKNVDAQSLVYYVTTSLCVYLTLKHFSKVV